MENDQQKCGWRSCTPSKCQRFRNAKCILFLLSCAGLVQGLAVNGLVSVVTSTIERRYDMKSTESGLINSCYDISAVFLLIPVTYFGGAGCKPRYIGIGMFVFGIGFLVFSLPHFLSDPYTVQDISYDGNRCNISSNGTSVCTGQENQSNNKYWFYIAQLIIGAGAVPLYTLGTTYLDENLPVRSSPLYLGIYYACATFGPTIGYIVGGTFLNIYTDFDRVKASSITIKPTNPQWVGAWWIGFLFCAVLAFIISIPMCGLPHHLPKYSEYMAQREKDLYKGKTTPTDRKVLSLRTIRRSFVNLFTNPTYVFLCLTAAVEGLLLYGFTAFGPKFLQYKFSLTASFSSQLLGYVSVISATGGMFFGGYLVKRLNLTVNGTLKFTVWVTVPMVVLLLVLLFDCDDIPYTGVNSDYMGTMSKTSGAKRDIALQHCNDNCHCSMEIFNPVCGSNGMQYYSPCYAGCSMFVSGTKPLKYTNCTCISYQQAANSSIGEATTGVCEISCSYLPLYMAVFAITLILTFISNMPMLSVVLRIIPHSEKSFALGLNLIIARGLGMIPGPIIFGRVIDITCILWAKKCNDDGACRQYDNHQLSLNIMYVLITGKCLSIIFRILALVLYRGSENKLVNGEVDGAVNLGFSNSVVSNDPGKETKTIPSTRLRN